MKTKKTLFLFVICLQQGFLFAQTNPLLKYLPENASQVTRFNFMGMLSKIPKGAFRESVLYRELTKDSSKLPLQSFFSNMDQAGIDFSREFFIASVTDTVQDHPEKLTHFFGRMQDEARFRTLMKTLFKKDSIYVYGTNRIIFKGATTIAWNNEVFVISSAKGKGDQMMYEDSASSNEKEQRAIEKRKMQIKETILKVKRNRCFALLTPHSNNFYNTDPHFTTLMNTPGDIAMWSNGTTNPLMKAVNPMVSMLKLPSFAQNKRTAIINFETGKVVMKSFNYLSDEISDIYKKYPAIPQNTALIRHLPQDKLLGFMNISFNPAMMKELLQKMGLQEKMDSTKAKLPFDVSLLAASFKSNMLLAFLKKDETTPVDSVRKPLSNVDILLVLPIANKAKFEELKTAVVRTWDSMQQAGSGKMLKGFKPIVKYNDELCVLSLSSEAPTAFLASPGETEPAWLQPYKQYPLLMNIRIKDLFALFMGKKSGGKSGKEKAILNMLDQLIISGGNYENDCMNTTIELRFTDPNQNALKQLFDLLNGIVAGEKENGQ
jgi:Domain of unknown function (DUF4836)